VHSTLSHDGKLAIAEVAELYRGHGFDFVAMGEHSQDMTPDRTATLIAECAAHSGSDFLIIPGVEFTCNNGMHILGIGVTAPEPESTPTRVAAHIRQHGGYSVLAHPCRFGWKCLPEIVAAVDAVEIWNIGYDGKFLPAPGLRNNLARFRAMNPKLHGIASHDLHRREAFYDVGVELEASALDGEAIVAGLRRGDFINASRFFTTGASPEAQLSWTVMHSLASQQAALLRTALSSVRRWLA